MVYKKLKNNRRIKGFTLIEVMVSVSIFVMIMVVGMGALITINSSYKKTQAQRAIMDSLSFAIESMSRDIRIGSNYCCGNSSTLYETRDCDCANGSDAFSFNPFGGVDYQKYFLEDGVIMRTVDGKEQPLTSSNAILITNLSFEVDGSSKGDNRQPFVFISISGKSLLEKAESKNFILQTAITQRLLDS